MFIAKLGISDASFNIRMLVSGDLVSIQNQTKIDYLCVSTPIEIHFKLYQFHKHGIRITIVIESAIYQNYNQNKITYAAETYTISRINELK